MIIVHKIQKMFIIIVFDNDLKIIAGIIFILFKYKFINICKNCLSILKLKKKKKNEFFNFPIL